MKIFVTVKPKAKFEKVERISNANFKVWVKEAPIKGKANIAIKKVLAKFLEISPSKICLVTGKKSKRKIFKIED